MKSHHTSTIGTAYASVLPEPVGADTQTSRGGSYGVYRGLTAPSSKRKGSKAV